MLEHHSRSESVYQSNSQLGSKIRFAQLFNTITIYTSASNNRRLRAKSVMTSDDSDCGSDEVGWNL